MLDKYFLILCGLFVGLIYSTFFRVSLNQYIYNKIISKTWVNKFCFGGLIVFLIPFILLQLIQLHIGTNYNLDKWPYPYNYFALLSITLPLISVLYWIWFLKGAPQLAKFYYYVYIQKDNGNIILDKYTLKVKYITTIIILLLIACSIYSNIIK